MRIIPVLLAFFVIAAEPAPAHDVTRSDSKIEVDGREVRVTLTLNPSELLNTGKSSNDVWNAVQHHYSVTSPSTPSDTTLENYSMLAGTLARMRIRYVFP